ncbi:MAG: cation transporter [Bacteroidota bacterium]
MKTSCIILLLLFILAALPAVHAQKPVNNSVNKESIQVWGECGMCKDKIEKAAKKAGAVTASWNENSKQLSVSYNMSKTSMEKIEQSVAAAGYDTKDVTADNEAYNKLPECCHYTRKEAPAIKPAN